MTWLSRPARLAAPIAASERGPLPESTTVAAAAQQTITTPEGAQMSAATDLAYKPGELTEAQAGSDLARVRTKAVPDGDHFRISGQKIFVTYGEHDLAPNIIHAVLGRTPNAPDGTDTLRNIEGVQGTGFADTFDATGYGQGGALNVSSSNGNFNQFEGVAWPLVTQRPMHLLPRRFARSKPSISDPRWPTRRAATTRWTARST